VSPDSSCLRQDGFGEIPVGHAANLDVKTERDKSMLRKQGPPEDVYGKIALQDPRDMVKATLPEPQFPAIKVAIPRSSRLLRGLRHHDSRTCREGTYQFPINLRTEGDGQRAHSRERTRHLRRAERQQSRNCGIAYGARALWRRSPHSSPRTGKPSTWRRGTGVVMPEHRGTRDA